MRYVAHTFVCFLAGAVAAINLETLVSVNPYYDAQWWKVALAVVTPLVVAASLSKGSR